MGNTATDVTKTERAIIALLHTTNLADAAREAGVPYSSFRRFINTPEFQVELREAKRATLDGALVNLSGLAQKAVEVIAAELNKKNVRVAQWVIDKGLATRDNDIEERLARLEGLAR